MQIHVHSSYLSFRRRQLGEASNADIEDNEDKYMEATNTNRVCRSIKNI